MDTAHHSIETGATLVAKTAPPISVSLATVFGYQVNEILLWATLIYTVLMIGHKLHQIFHDVLEKKALAQFRARFGEHRVGLPDTRENPVERRRG